MNATTTEARAEPGGGVSRLVVALAVTGTFTLAFGAFWLSFTTLRDLAVLSGIHPDQAWIWPIIVDGVILEATISVVALRDAARPARRFAWMLLSAGAAVSVGANITHAVLEADARVPVLIGALVASVPPLVLLSMTHLSVELARNRTRADGNAEAAPPSSSGPTVPARPQRALPAAPRRQDATREDAVALAAGGMPVAQIARELGVHRTTAARWVNAPDRNERST